MNISYSTTLNSLLRLQKILAFVLKTKIPLAAVDLIAFPLRHAHPSS